MLFASTTLAARIERAECGLLADSARAVADARPEADVVVERLAGGVAIYAGEGSPLNKVAGLGLAGAFDEAGLEPIECLYASRDADVQVELSSLADAAIGAALSARGYRLVGFENVLGRALSADDTETPAGTRTRDTGIGIRESGSEDFASWLDTVVTGFSSPDDVGVPSHESFPREALERVLSDMAGARGMRRFIATRDGEPAGGGSMRLDEGIAQLCGASTLPAHRRRGVQTALLAHRLSEAARSGCDVAVVTTQPASTSQKNVQRRGFELLYARAVLVLRTSGSSGA